MKNVKVASGIFWVDIPEADLHVLCGCPEDTVKHLIRQRLIAGVEKGGVTFETGPNAILLSDTPIQKGQFANLAEFPLLQMFYRQGMAIPRHPGNTGRKPLLIGLGAQVRAQEAYFSRGTYGLRSPEELVESGVDPQTAAQMMKVKRWFAFGSLRETAELVDTRALDGDAVSIAPGVVVHRRGFNRYEFLTAGETVEVDLTLGPGENFESVVRYPPVTVRSAAFSIIHTGEGDGWDTERPCMSSVVCWQGRFYLVDAGPQVRSSLDALGIGVGEVEGIFHTHVHDDHFAGLTSLVRSERRLKYYAAPCVRATAQKKLAALMGIDTEAFRRFFDVHDLAAGEWNDVDGLAVRPVVSPHPVETTVFSFRAAGADGGSLTYAHLADIPSFDVLAKLAAPGTSGPALAEPARAAFQRELLTPATLKKIDAGGGMIHGDAADFAADTSGKVIPSHGAAGSTVGFGDQDVLIAGSPDELLRRTARAALASLFPAVHAGEREKLVSCPLVAVPPGGAVLPAGTRDVRLVLRGIVETALADGTRRRRESGALLGLPGREPLEACRALSGVTALAIPGPVFGAFLDLPGAAESLRAPSAGLEALARCPLFEGIRSEAILRGIASVMDEVRVGPGRVMPREAAELCILIDGEVDLAVGECLLEAVLPGGFWGEERVTGAAAAISVATAVGPCSYFAIPADILSEIPLVLWTLMETLERRMRSLRAGFCFEWSESFSVGIPELDDQHRHLFALVNGLSVLLAESGTISGHDGAKQALLEHTRFHFQSEEDWLSRCSYPRLEVQEHEHRDLLKRLETFVQAGERRARPRTETVIDYLKDWLIRHTLLEDMRYASFYAAR